MRLPIIKLVQSLRERSSSITKELAKPKPETTVLASGARIHYIDFEKLRKYKTSNVLKAKEIEMKKIVKS
jgi:hypothetical protein